MHEHLGLVVEGVPLRLRELQAGELGMLRELGPGAGQIFDRGRERAVSRRPAA